jgi:hypothetical protein
MILKYFREKVDELDTLLLFGGQLKKSILLVFKKNAIFSPKVGGNRQKQLSKS